MVRLLPRGKDIHKEEAAWASRWKVLLGKDIQESGESANSG